MRVELEVPAVDLLASLRWHRVGFRDPGVVLDKERYAIAFHGPAGPSMVSLTPKSRTEVVAELEGATEELVPMLRSICGAEDDPEGLLPLTAALPRLNSLARRARLARMPKVPWRYEVAIGIILQQRVDFPSAAEAYAALAQRHGAQAPGSLGLKLLPDAATLLALPSHAFRALGVDGQRERALRTLAESHALTGEAPRVREQLSALPGIGPWTVESIMGLAFGDADAVPTGDYWLPHMVAHAMKGQARATDEEMLALLAPYRPHRGRLIRVLHDAGYSAPRFGARQRRGPHEGVRR